MAKAQRLPLKGGRKGNGWKPGMENKINILGMSGVELIQLVLGGVQTGKNSPEGDLEKVDLGIEVKTGGNTDPLRVDENQLNNHLSQWRSGFPYSRYWYVFLKYRNREKTLRLFQRESGDVPGFLGRRLTGVYVADISIVDAIREKMHEQGVKDWMRRGEGILPAVRIGWRFLEQLSLEPSSVIKALGLDPRNFSFCFQETETEFQGYRLRVPLFSAVAEKAKRKSTATNLRAKKRKTA